VFYKEYEFGHLAFLFPPQKRHFYEMLELCKTFNPDMKPGPMGDYQIPRQLITLLESSEAEKTVKNVVTMY